MLQHVFVPRRQVGWDLERNDIDLGRDLRHDDLLVRARARKLDSLHAARALPPGATPGGKPPRADAAPRPRVPPAYAWPWSTWSSVARQQALCFVPMEQPEQLDEVGPAETRDIARDRPCTGGRRVARGGAEAA